MTKSLKDGWQKMQFLSNDDATLIEPTYEMLLEYFKDNPEKYLSPYTYTFYQIIFSPDNRKDNFHDALETLNQFPLASFDKMKNKGDILLLPIILMMLLQMS